MTQLQEFSRLPQRRTQLIRTESLLLIAALLSQLAFVFWLGMGTSSMNSPRELTGSPGLWILFSANILFWTLIFITRFCWQGFENGSNRDVQTGLYDRGYFERLLEMEMRRAGRYHHPLTLCFLDIDRFAAYNQKLGRKKGDELLRKFAEFLQGCVRITDLTARYERDEFVVLLPHTDALRAEKFVSRIVAQMQERIDCSFSAGLTAFHAGDSREQVLARALSALKEAKQEGTGKVRSFSNGHNVLTALPPVNN